MKEILKGFAIGLIIISSITGIIVYFTSAKFLSTLFLVWGAIWINGCIASWEDAMPGGFDNIDGEVPVELKGKNKFKFWLLTLASTATLFGLGGYLYVSGY